MKRASYKFGVEWISLNDDPETLDAEEIAGYISTLLLADLFDVEASKVALDIVRCRKKIESNNNGK